MGGALADNRVVLAVLRASGGPLSGADREVLAVGAALAQAARAYL